MTAPPPQAAIGVVRKHTGLARVRVGLLRLLRFAALTLLEANPISRSSRSTGCPAAHPCARRLFVWMGVIFSDEMGRLAPCGAEKKGNKWLVLPG